MPLGSAENYHRVRGDTNVRTPLDGIPEKITCHEDVLRSRKERIEAALEQSRYAYERGRYGYLEWVAAQRELLDMRRALLRAAAELHQFRIEIERLTGTALPVPVQR